MKRLLALLSAVLLSFMLFACDGEVTEHSKVFGESLIVYAEGDTQRKVTQDIELVWESDLVPHAEISWTSSNEEVIEIVGDLGVVTRGEEDVRVGLVLSVDIDGDVKTKTTTVTVLKLEDETPGSSTVEPEYDDFPEVEGSMSIADFLEFEKEEGDDDPVIVGVITSLAPYNSFSMEDETGAVAFRIGGKNADTIEFEVGDVIVAPVKKGVFNGLIQAELVGEEFEIIEGNFKRLGVVDLTDADLSELIEYQSRTVDLDDVDVTKVSIDSYGTIVVTVDNGNGTIQVRWDNRIDSFDTTLIESLKAGDTISIKGATLGWSNGARIELDVTEQLVLVERGPEPTTPPTETEEPEPSNPGEGALYYFDFGSAGQTGYGEGVLQFEAGEKSFNFFKNRVQSNTSNFAPHTNYGAFLIFSIRDTSSEAYFEMDLTNLEEISNISFKISTWNNSILDGVKEMEDGFFGLVIEEDGQWVKVDERNLIELLVADEHARVSYEDLLPGKYRFVYNGTSDAENNTTHTVTLDDLAIFGVEGEIVLPTEPTEPTTPVEEPLYLFDFGTSGKTGYGEGELEFESNGYEMTFTKDRVQSNTSNNLLHFDRGAFLIFSIRDTHSEAYADFDLSHLEELTKITFKLAVWNNDHLGSIKDMEDGYFGLMVKEDEQWVKVDERNLIDSLLSGEYVELSYEDLQPGEYRLVYSGTSEITGNTTHAITLDDLAIYGVAGEVIEPTEPTDPTGPVEPIEFEYTETFEEMSLEGSSYASGSHKGPHGQLWTYNDARGDLELDGKALLLRNGSLKTELYNGLSKLSFEYDRAFTGTGARTFEVIVNGVVIDTITINPEEDERLTYISADLEYAGYVTLEIKGIGAQKLIDNVAWNSFDDGKEYVIVDINLGYDDLAYKVQLEKGEALVEIEVEERIGYELVRWEVEEVQFDLATPITDPITVVAIWEKVEIDGPVTITAKYEGATSNMADGNNAETLGLSEEVFTVTSDKGQQENHVGLNAAGQVRLYAHRASGEGSKLVIEIDEEYEITEIKITFGASTNTPRGELLLGAALYELDAEDITNTNFEASDLAINYFSLENVQTKEDNSKNGQVFILSIEITYQKK